jgi:hypothetical protein
MPSTGGLETVVVGRAARALMDRKSFRTTTRHETESSWGGSAN